MQVFIGFLIIILTLLLALICLTQPISALVRRLAETRHDSKYAIGLNRYLSFVIVYIIVLFLGVQSPFFFSDHTQIIYFLIIPLAKMIWYVRFTKKWDVKHSRISEYDHELTLNVPCKERLDLERRQKKPIKLKKLKNGLKVRTALS